jgi:TolB-like protein/cytochrome c-type biogenesis protein CcmH/NrfG
LAGLDHWLIGGLSTAALVVVAVMLVRIGGVEPEPMYAVHENSIAVLPFEVCEGQSKDSILAGGLTMEVINHLAGRERLKVTAHGSVFRFAGAGLPLPEIARPLRVQYLLTGELCRDGINMTLAARLAHADGFITWSERYVQGVNELDQIEDRLAALVANAVAKELGDITVAAVDAPINRLAYEQLLVGQEYQRQRDMVKAQEAFERALELQPGYPEVVYGLAQLELGSDRHGTKIDKLENARRVAEDALALARAELKRGRETYQSHYIIGQILHQIGHWDEALTWRQSDDFGDEDLATQKAAAQARFAESEQHLRAAIGLNPSMTKLYSLLAATLEHQGVERNAEALEVWEQGLDRDPFNEAFNRIVSFRLAGLGRYRQAMEQLERFGDLGKIPHSIWWCRLEIMNNTGHLDEKIETLVELLLNEPEVFGPEGLTAVFGHLPWAVPQLAGLGLFEEAAAWYSRIQQLPLEAESGDWWFRQLFLDGYLVQIGQKDEVIERALAKIGDTSKEEIFELGWYAGVINSTLVLAGQYERAIELLEFTRHQQQDEAWAERQTNDAMRLAELYQKVGREDDAVPVLEEIVVHLEGEIAAGIRHPETLSQLAQAYARLGLDKEALDMLRKAVDYNVWMTSDEMAGAYLAYPAWERLKDEPRFIEQLNRMHANRDRQAQNIRTLLAQYDLDELLAPLMESTEETDAETKDE